MVQIKPGPIVTDKNFVTSQEYLGKKSTKVGVSSNMARSVSQHRRGILEEEVLQGKFKDDNDIAGNIISHDPFAPSPAGFVTSNNKGLSKQASSGTVGGTTGYRGSGGTLRQSPDVYNPHWLNSNLNLPRDRPTVNSWSRAYFALNGLVQNAISLHSTYPISKLNIKCKNPKVEEFFSNMNEEIDLTNICVQIAQEYWILGEAFVYAELDESNRKWSRLFIHNPDFINVERSVVADEPIISLRPDDNLKKICNGNKPSDIQQRQKLDKSIIEHVKRGENIPLNNFYVSHLARKINPYDVRGTGLIVSSFRQLMLFDKMREAKFAQADNMINPLTLVKIGGDDYKPSPVDLDAWRQVFEEAQNDKDFKIFTHDKVAVERVGHNSAIIDISNDVTQLIKEIFIGLLVPSVLMDGGADTTYANGGVALDVLRQRYMTFRNMLTIWLRRKIFAPISKINDFYDYVDEKKVLVVPDVEWNHMSLFDIDSYISVLKDLAAPQGDQKRSVSYQTLFRSLGVSYEDEIHKIRKEDIDEAIRAKEKESLANMSLNELRALGASDQIQEVAGKSLPGQTGEPGSENEPGLPGVPPPGAGGAPPV
jgi:hypothetical protein